MFQGAAEGLFYLQGGERPFTNLQTYYSKRGFTCQAQIIPPYCAGKILVFLFTFPYFFVFLQRKTAFLKKLMKPRYRVIFPELQKVGLDAGISAGKAGEIIENI